MVLVRLGVGLLGGLGALMALAPAFTIPLGQANGQKAGMAVGFLILFALIGMGAASPTVRVAFGRSLKVVGVCFWIAIAVGIIAHYPWLLPNVDPAQLQYASPPVLLIGGLFGGLLYLIGYFATRSPEPGTPADLANRLQSGAENGLGRFDESLSHLQGFNAYYREHIAGWLAQQERRRKGALRYRLIVLVVGLPIMAAITMAINALISFDDGFWGNVVGWAVLIAWLLFFGIAFAKSFKLSDDIKAFMIGHLCKFFRLRHIADSGSIDLDLYRTLDLIPDHSFAEMKEAFAGNREHVDMFMAEVVAYVYRGTGARRRRAAKFSGAVLQFTYRKRFQGQTIAVSDRGKIGNLIKQVGRPKQRIRMENTAFEERFEVFGTDEIESRYLLTPLFMERMVALSDLIGANKKMRFAFAENQLLVVVPGWDLFEAASLAHATTNPVHVQTFLSEIGLVLDVADIMKLNLDSRI